MPLQFVQPQAEVWSAYQQSLLDFLGPHQAEAKFYHLPVGTLDLVALANGATLQDVVPSGCRFITAWPDGTVTSCEMTDPTVYAQAQFRNFVQNDLVKIAFERITEAVNLAPEDLVKAAVAGINEAADSATAQAEGFELHFLSIPGIHLEALHLVDKVHGFDLILPVLSEYPQLATDAVLDGPTFLARARAIAAARLALPASSNLSS
jgi:hypothetical protein